LKQHKFFKHDCDHCNFLGSHEDSKGKCDLYYHPPNNGVHGETLVIRYSSEPSDYSSGIIFAYIADMKREYDSHYYIAIKKAIEMKYLKQENYFIGYSEKKHDEEYEKYFETDYYKNKPKNPNFELESSEKISDEEWDKNDDCYDKENEIYENKYFKIHNKIPSSPSGFVFMFDNEKEMIENCNNGNFKIINATSREHALKLMENSLCRDNFYKTAFKSE
jgi:hypothetical protein